LAPNGDSSAAAHAEAATGAAETTQEVHRASAEAVEAINIAYLNAYKEQVGAYLAWIEKLMASTKGTPVYSAQPTVGVVEAAEAYRTYLLAQLDQQVAVQKAVLEGAPSYVQALKESQDKLEERVRQHSGAMADALKDALVKTEVRPDNVQALAVMYHALRTMGGGAALA